MKKLFVLLVLVFCFGLVAAHSDYYDIDGPQLDSGHRTGQSPLDSKHRTGQSPLDSKHRTGQGYVYKERIVESEYFPDEHLTVSRTTYVDYENDERFPTEDYKYGYTYRATSDYLNSRYWKKVKKVDYVSYEKRGYDNGRYYDEYDYGNRDYYFKWDWRLGDYKKVECWNEPPRGQLFYFKC